MPATSLELPAPKRRTRRIYLASSWKQARTVSLMARLLRFAGHEIYAFTEPDLGHYVFDARHTFGSWVEGATARQMMQTKEARRAFAADRDGLNWADTCILILPAGRSSHLEAGYAVGQGKDLFILDVPVPGEWDVMYGFARAICEDIGDLCALLADEKPCEATKGGETDERKTDASEA